MTDWDADSEQLRANLHRVLSGVRRDARQRVMPTVEAARKWQSDVMHGLTPPEPHYVGRFRGEPGLEGCEVSIGEYRGVPSARVAEELNAFEAKLQSAVKTLDGLIAPQQEISADELAAVIDLCAWAHAEWVRIHPFANGNGRTARLWANFIAMRYGLPPFARFRPRPDDGYGAASAAAIEGDWRPTVRVFRRLLRDAVRP
jgi:Fic/DOC family